MNQPSAPNLQQWLASVGPVAAVEALASLLPDAAVFAVDGERRVQLWSRGAERLLGFRADDVVGEPCSASNRCHNCLVGCGLSERRQLDDVPIVLVRADGRPIAVRKTARAFFGPGGRFLGGVELLVPDPEGEAPSTELPGDATAFHGLMTRDPGLRALFEVVRSVAATDATVLVRGESGTGKEGIAKAIHLESARAGGPFVAINCASLSPTLLESELFGHVRGAFTGALRDHNGLFVSAHGGTLFLDEVAELPVDLQARLLRVLQEHEVTPVGATRPRKVDVRIVAATHRSLRRLVAEGRFREDLLYRLRVVPLFLPPLRERRDDLPLLLWHFIEARNARGQRVVRQVATDALRALLDHAWPGNIRELQNVVDYAFAVGRGPALILADLPPELRGADAHPSLPTAKPEAARRSAEPLEPSEAERVRIARALAEADGHVGRAAALLGMSRPTFWRRRKLYPELNMPTA